MHAHCGDQLTENKNELLQIGLIINNVLPNSNFNSHIKNHLTYRVNTKLDPDIVEGLAEVNWNWNRVSSIHQQRNQTIRRRETLHTSLVYNTKDILNNSPFQPGGIILQSINKLLHRMIQAIRIRHGQVNRVGHYTGDDTIEKSESYVHTDHVYRPLVVLKQYILNNREYQMFEEDY